MAQIELTKNEAMDIADALLCFICENNWSDDQHEQLSELRDRVIKYANDPATK